MLNKIFNQNPTEKKSVVGIETELIHDATCYQYGSVVIDGTRYCAKIADGSEMRKGTVVRVLEENSHHGTVVLTVEKV